MKPQVSRRGFLDMQVCVPKDWTDEQVKTFADEHNPCGTTGGWFVRKQINYKAKGQLERQPCEDHEDFVHIVLDA